MLQAIATLIAVLMSTAYSLLGVASPDAIHRSFPLESCSVGVADSRVCDPVNLVFPGKSWEQVRDALRESGWTTGGFGSRQLIDFGIEGLVLEDEQLFYSDTGDARYHVRLWQGPGLVTFASVHHEVDDLANLRHRLDQDWDKAEAFVAGTVCPLAMACSQTSVDVGQAALQGGDDEWRGWANDARLMVIVLR